MQRKVLLLFAIIVTVSLSACTDNTVSSVDSTGVEVVTSTVSTEEGRRTGDGSDSTGLLKSSSEQVNEPSETESVVSKPTEPSETEAPSEQITVVSQPTVPESTETSTPSTAGSEPMPIAPPTASEPEPTPTAPSATPEPQPTEPSFDVSRYVSYAQSYGAGIGLVLDSTATACWDTPIEAHAGCIYLERDIGDCLNWYKDSGYTAFWVWSVDVGGGNYEIYIGYV